ncbi:hypothetical protein AGLY_003069 [Aphis glycines]|uniref:Uncharacterized protein n=1 Tax=Aphis glycines TaxID=307491 RepID=A0A6G0U218_APHGL|nr:hypothetical protein AGLY_003069 [Aphis glycines]
MFRYLKKNRKVILRERLTRFTSSLTVGKLKFFISRASFKIDCDCYDIVHTLFSTKSFYLSRGTLYKVNFFIRNTKPTSMVNSDSLIFIDEVNDDLASIMRGKDQTYFSIYFFYLIFFVVFVVYAYYVYFIFLISRLVKIHEQINKCKDIDNHDNYIFEYSQFVIESHKLSTTDIFAYMVQEQQENNIHT